MGVFAVEQSGRDCSDPVPPEVGGSEPRKTKRKIIWKKVTEFDNEMEAELYLADSWTHWKTNRTKLDSRKSSIFYCKRHGKSCPPQAKYEHVPGGKFILYESEDQHDYSRVARNYVCSGKYSKRRKFKSAR